MHTGTQAIDRAAQLLVAVIEGDHPVTVGELAAATGLPKSTVSRSVAALERSGLVQRPRPRGGLRPGPVLMRLARRGVGHDDIVVLCKPAMKRLGEMTEETIDLAVPVPGGVEHYLAQVDSRHFLGSTNWVGRTLPHHATAVGKCLMAFAAAPAPEPPLRRFTTATICEPEALAGELERTRARGFATVEGELEPGLMAVAAPIRDATGRAVAAISISGPGLRLTPPRLEQLGHLLLAETASVSAAFGDTNQNEGTAA